MQRRDGALRRHAVGKVHKAALAAALLIPQHLRSAACMRRRWCSRCQSWLLPRGHRLDCREPAPSAHTQMDMHSRRSALHCHAAFRPGRRRHLHAHDRAVRREALVQVYLVGVGRHVAHVAAAGAAWWQLRRAARRHRVAAHQRVAARRHALAHPGVPIAGSALRIPVHGPLSEHATMADRSACAGA